MFGGGAWARAKGPPGNLLPPPGCTPLPQFGCSLGTNPLSAPILSDVGPPWDAASMGH